MLYTPGVGEGTKVESHRGSLPRAHQASVALQSPLTLVHSATNLKYNTHKSPPHHPQESRGFSEGPTLKGTDIFRCLAGLGLRNSADSGATGREASCPSPTSGLTWQAALWSGTGERLTVLKSCCLSLNPWLSQSQPYQMDFSNMMVGLLMKGRVYNFFP